jgi:uncharacterized protein
MVGFRAGRLLRIFINDNDRCGAGPKHAALVEFLRSEGIAGATVFRGIEGFGSHREIHIAKLFSWLPNLPIMVEVIDDAGKIDAILPELEQLIGEGLITLGAVDYIQRSRSSG